MIAMLDPGHRNFGKIIVTFNKFPLNLGQSVVLTLLTKYLAADWMVSIYLDSDWSFLLPILLKGFNTREGEKNIYEGNRIEEQFNFHANQRAAS